MSGGLIALLIVFVLAALVLGFYMSSTAGRLDHLHKRIDTSRLTLDAHLLRRSSVTLEIAASGLLDPATSMLLAESAHEARLSIDADEVARSQAESDLTAALRAVLEPVDVAEIRSSTGGAEMLDELSAACQRVNLSRRFHNDAVRACRELRDQGFVRVFRLAGHTAWPQMVEMDDEVPEAIG